MARKLGDVNWNQVYYFFEVARRMSMKEASKIIGVSTPTISEHIKKLETRLDVKLFKRKTRQIELTNEGRNLFNHAEEMFNSGVRFLDSVSPKSIGGYPVKIGVLETISIKLQIDFVFRYLRKYSDFGSVNTLRETSHDRLENRIINGELDWGISLYQNKLSALECRQIGHSQIVFCASERLYSKFPSKKELLRQSPLVRSSWDHKLNKLVHDHLLGHDIVVEEYFESDHRNFCIAIVQKGLCVTTLPKDEIERSSWGRDLRAFSIGSPIHLPFYALWPKGSHKMIAVKKLLECFQG